LNGLLDCTIAHLDGNGRADKMLRIFFENPAAISRSKACLASAGWLSFNWFSTT
jgi:hypothetical protein